MIPARLIVRRAQSELFTRVLRQRGAAIPNSVRFIGLPTVHLVPDSTLRIGARTRFISDTYFATLGAAHPVVLRTMAPGAVLEFGEDIGITSGSFCAARKVSVGDGTIFGAGVMVADTDFHPLTHPARRHQPVPEGTPADEVVIGRNVFIGTRVIVLKGSRIGDNAVIGAGSIVRGHVPANSVAAGNPARVLRTFDLDEVTL